MRARWACDGDGPQPTLAIPCEWCDGTGCRYCDGRKVDYIYSCPWRIVNDDGDLRAFLELYQWTKRPIGLGGIGYMPEAGGILDQPATFLEAVALLDAEFEKLRPKDTNDGNR